MYCVSVEINIEQGRSDLLVLLSDLMLHYSVKMPLRGAFDSDQPKTMLLSWINFPLKSSYNVNNFTDDWKDGRALGSLLNSIYPDMCPDWSKWDYENCEANIKLAMSAAQEYLLGVEKLIDPGDMCNPAASDTVAITYLSQLLSATLILPGNKFRKVLNDRTTGFWDYADIYYDNIQNFPFESVEEESNNLEISHLPFDVRNAYDGLYKKVEYESRRIEIHKVFYPLFVTSDDKSVYYKIRGSMNGRFDLFLVKTNITGSKVEAGILAAHTQSLLDHDNVMKVIALTVQGGELHTIMPGTNCVLLQPYLTENKELDASERLDIVDGIAKAMDYLAGRDYVLQKLTTKTCMVATERKVKIYDLSCIAELDVNGTAEIKQDITTSYRNFPPEVFVDKVFRKESDVYVYGIFVWTVFNESVEPYQDDDLYSVLSRKNKNHHLPQTCTMSSRIYQLLTRCWAEQYYNRPTFKEVIREIHVSSSDNYEYIGYYDSDNEPQI
ncbi:hypothetical protein LSH36_1507g00000 [Paralvinella palmiformis]|uniref:Uncharacterized protein n=1 Tax=Paralvinella palmiformis TaxID=53620 RepID=A0AAD9MQ47_9ANNE|nr:hypothetical protein LSH36_1507g00000 [Paralvinella palmiformis]